MARNDATPILYRRRYAITAIAAVGLVLGASAAQATVYTWTDAQGVRHYSDTPRVADARVARLASDPAADASSTTSRRATPSNDAPTGDARALNIVSPQPDQVFASSDGQIPVSVTVGGDTELGDGEALRYALDGAEIGDGPTRSTRLTLSNVAPGAHALSVTLLYRGHAVQHSVEIPFRLQRGHVSTAGGPLPENGRPPS